MQDSLKLWTIRKKTSRIMMSILILLFLPFSLAQDCSSAPPDIQRICLQISAWDTRSRTVEAAPQVGISSPGFGGSGPLAALVPQQPSNAFECMTISCLCGFFGGTGGDNCVLANGQRLGPAVRTEYRVMTDAQRQRYHTAMWTIKGNGDYNDLSRIHSMFQTSPGAHSGPAFHPWHREFIKRLEIAIRRVDPGVSLPYWDSVMDNNLPNPVDSILWGNELMGSPSASDNQVRTGAFRNWPILDGSRGFRRNLGVAARTIYSEANINAVVNATDFHDVLANTAAQNTCPNVPPWTAAEYVHGTAHNFVGGDMLLITTSTNDPIFFNHHCFVDLIWELWRQRQQSRNQRETQYPTDDLRCFSSNHFGGNTMQPWFPFVNTDGLSNMYIDNLASYAPRPSCAANNLQGCGSRFLFCDLSHGPPRCTSKIRIGGNCVGFTRNEDRCYQGVCVSNRCQMMVAPPMTTQPPVQTTPPAVPGTEATCYNEQECCQPWAARGECQRNRQYMNQWCPAACGICTPRYAPSIECNNRNAMCSAWAQRGECTNNPNWMRENCRQACGRCGTTREQICYGSTTTATPAPQVSTCLNDHYCCVPWATNNYCSTNPGYMLQNCPSACRQCNGPANWNGPACVNLHPSCNAWATRGECSNNPTYMLENCRPACGRCDLLNQSARLRACGFQASARSRFINTIKPKSLRKNILPPTSNPPSSHRVGTLNSRKQRWKATKALRRNNQAGNKSIQNKQNRNQNNNSKKPIQQRAKQQRTTNKKTSTLNRWKQPVKKNQKKP